MESPGRDVPRQRIQKLVFPEGISIDTEKRQFIISKVKMLFSLKCLFIKDSKDDLKNTDDGGLSCLAEKVIEISNLEFGEGFDI